MSKIQSAKIKLQPMRLLNSIYGLNGKETKTKPVTSDDYDNDNNTEKKQSKRIKSLHLCKKTKNGFSLSG